MFKTSFTKEQLEKLGNTLLFLTDGQALNKTQLLKLTYLLDEYSIKLTGIPFFNFEYKVWKYGPVKQDLFIDLSANSPNTFKNFIRQKGKHFIPAEGAQFSDDEFNDFELDLLKKVKSKFSTKWASQLVGETHRPGRPWHKAVEKYGLKPVFDSGGTNSTDLTIDMTSLIEGDTFKVERYKEYLSIKGEPN